jgi:hypothetical protein
MTAAPRPPWTFRSPIRQVSGGGSFSRNADAEDTSKFLVLWQLAAHGSQRFGTSRLEFG